MPIGVPVGRVKIDPRAVVSAFLRFILKSVVASAPKPLAA